MRLKDKTAIITGGAQGIGRATAELFVAEGARVAIVDVDAAKAAATAAELDGGRGVCFGMACDVTKPADCEAAVKAVIDKWGKLDILVNNAGLTKDNLVMRISEADWDLVLDVNLKGTFNFTKAATRPMLKARGGRIVNLTSLVGLEGLEGAAGQANYAASKGGVVALTKAVAREFASRGITSNAVAPGFIRTRLTDAIPEEAKKKLYEKILMGRPGEPLDIAKAILFLSSDDASYITGHVLSVNGGAYM
jgi:3-oxoacyl-[acyl-carrier protein] reductase